MRRFMRLAIQIVLIILAAVVAVNYLIPGRWRGARVPTDRDLFAVSPGGEGFVVVGAGGTILTSPNGVTWTLRQSPTPVDLRAVTCTGNRCLAVGDSGTVLSTADTVDWQVISTREDLRFHDIISAGGRYWAVAEKMPVEENRAFVLRSETGSEWATALEVGGGSLRAIRHGGDRLVAVGFDVPSIAPVIYSSADGVTWIRPDPGVGVRVTPLYERNWTTAPWLRDVGFANGTFLAGGRVLEYPNLDWRAHYWIHDLAIRSTDGVNWTPGLLCVKRRRWAPAGSGLGITALTHDGREWIGVRGDGTARRSPDGITWSLERTGVKKELYGLAAAQGRVVAVGAGGTVLLSR